MKNKKRKLILSVLTIALTAICFNTFGKKESIEGMAKSGLPENYVTLSNNSATFAYQTLPEVYQNVSLYGSTESSNIKGAMVFTAVSNDSSGTDVSMTFSTVISATQLTQSFNLLEYLVVTDELKQRSESEGDAPVFDSISLTLTEKNNPQNYIKISNLPSRWHNYASLIRVSTSTMSAAGLDRRGSFYDSNGLLSGSGVQGSLSGAYLKGDVIGSIPSVSYKFDSESMTVYANRITTGNQDILVRDLDNPSHMIGLDKVFAKFTTDELTATLSVDGLKGKAQIAVLGFNGAKLYGESAETIVDTNKPIVYATNHQDGVTAEVGMAFPVFNFSSYDDIDGLTGIDEYKVYYDYGKLTQKEVNVLDNIFIPEKEGVYTIVAQKTDSSMNKGIALYTVEAVKKLPPFMISLQDEISTNGIVGTYVTLPKAIVRGGTVGTDYALSVWLGDDQIELDKWNGFTLESQGLYTVKYSVFDYRNVPYVFEYYIESKLDKAPIVVFPNMPKYVAVGTTLAIPEFEAIDWYSYAGIPRSAVISATIQLADGTIKEIDEYTFNQAGTYTYTLTAKACKGNASVSKSYEIQAINTEYVSDYFIRENVDIAGEEEMVFEAKGNGAKLSFINALPVANYSLKFNVSNEYQNFSSVSLIFSDRDAIDQKVTVNCSNGYISLCGKTVKVDSTFGGSDYAISLKNNALFNLSNKVGDIEKYDNGLEFRGFSSGCVYLDIVFSGVEGKAGIQVKTLGNHSYFEKDATDISVPIVYIDGEIQSIVKIGEVMQIPKITAYDVFDGECVVKLRVFNGTEEVLVTDNMFAVTNFGTYILRIETTDSTGHKTTINKNIYCHNQTGPTIIVQDKVPTSGKVGDAIKLVPAQAVDYFGNEVEVRIFVLKKGGAYVMVEENNTFIPDEQTEYVIWYTATDSEFNTTILKFVVKV